MFQAVKTYPSVSISSDVVIRTKLEKLAQRRETSPDQNVKTGTNDGTSTEKTH